MAAVASAPATHAQALETAGKDRRNVSAKLVYWKRLDQPLEPLNFTLPGAEQRFEEQASLNESHQVTVHDVRGEEHNYTLDRNGFQYVEHEVKELEKCLSEDEIRDLLLPATEELVKKVTGAHKTIIFTHRIRSLATDDSKRADNRAPAHSVHSDFTSTGALHHLETVVKDPAELEQLLKTQSRVLFINVWRPLKQIFKDPLAVCDWASFQQTDLVPNRMIFPQFWNELGKANFSEQQKWCYLSHQKPSEPLIFKQFDNKAQGGMTLPHSAFVDPEFVDSAPRESIEIKMVAFL